MKRKSIFVIGSVLAAGLLVGSTFAAWAVTDKADPFNVGITPGTISDDENDSVTLEWGSRELVKVENLSYQEEKGPYKVGLKATTGSGEGFTGNLLIKFTFQGEVAPQLLNYLYVDVYDDAKPEPNAQNPVQPTKLLTLDKNCTNLTANKDLDVTSGQVRDVYFYIGLKGIENPAQYDALKNDVVNLQVDWNKGSQVEEITSRTYYFKNTEEWAKVYAYAWLEEDGTTNAEWPGLEMKNAKDDIFALDIPVKYDKIIFNNGLEEQTDDLTVVADKPYWDGAKWDVAPSSGEITEVEYYLVGTMNDWKAVEGYKLVQDTENKNKYTIKDLELEKDAKMKVLDPAKGDNGWFSNAGTWEKCGFTIDEEGNVVLSAAGTYDVEFYVVGDNNNHIVPVIHGVDPQPTETVYHLAGTFNEWNTTDENTILTKVSDSEYVIEHVALEKDDEIKAVNPELGDQGWYGVDHVYEGCGYEMGDGGNAKVPANGNYTVHLYLDSTDGNYLKLVAEA